MKGPDDSQWVEMIRPIFRKLADKSAQDAAAELNERKVPTMTGRPWSAVNVVRARRRLARN